MSVTATANPAFVPQSPSHWVPDDKRSSCKTCHKDFTFFNRRHHCRSCREVFCGECSDFRLLTRDPKDPTVVVSVRACRPCFDKFRGRKIRGQKTNSGMATASSTVAHSHTEQQLPPQHVQHVRREVVEMPPQHLFEGEDPDITGQETIRHEEDEDHYVYPDAQSRDVTLVTGVSSDSHASVDRDAVMAAQGSVVLPSKSVDGGLQFVEVDQSASRLPGTTGDNGDYLTTNKDMTLLDKSVGGEKDEFDRTTVGAVEGSEEILNIPSDALASVKNANVGTTTTTVTASTVSGSQDGIQYFRSDPCQVVVVQQLPGDASQGETVVTADTIASMNSTSSMTDLPRSVSGVEGSEEIMSIPSDALASVKHANLTTAHQLANIEKNGDVAWSERNVESQSIAQTPTGAVPMLFDDASSTGDQQHRPPNLVV